MSNFKVKQQVRSEVPACLIKGKLFHKIDRLAKAEGVGAEFQDLTLPDPAALADGVMAYNVDRENIEVTAAHVWVETKIKELN